MWFGLLGRLSVRDDDGVELPIAGARQRELLVALLMRAGRIVPAGELAEIVWSGAPPDRAAVTLRSYVKRLRQSLREAGSRIVTSQNGYAIDVSGSELDLTRFSDLCGAGAAARREGSWAEAGRVLAEALALWRGTPFADLPADVLDRSEVARLEELRLQALEWRIEADLQLGRTEGLVAQLRALAAEHPLRERFHAQLMLALHASGRPAEALAAYQQAREVLVDELGTDPGAELQAIHQRVLTGDPGLTDGTGPASPRRVPDAVPHQLPAATGHFVGRSAELSALAGLLDGGGAGATVVISAIGGTAGIGKTALAVHWAHQVADQFPDGQLYVNLRGYDPTATPVAPAEAVRGFLHALSVPPSRVPASLDEQAALYRSLLAGRSMLVVLDNARDASHARPLLPGSAGCLVIVTSRGQLAGLAAAEGAHLLTLDLLSSADTRELLVSRLDAARVAAEPAAVDELAALCARLPLALSIVAARVATRPGLPLAALTAELRDDRLMLDALDTGDSAACVRAAFSWSYQNLSLPAARMFRLLGMHLGPDISAAAAARLAGVPARGARQLLRELTSVHVLTEHAAGRFAFHDLLRAFAIEEGREQETGGDLHAAQRRLIDYYRQAAYEAALLLNPSRDPFPGAAPRPEIPVADLDDHGDALAWFEAEHAVLLAVIAQAAAVGMYDHVGHISWSLADYLDRRGHWHDWAATHRAAVAAAIRAGDRVMMARAYRNLARASTELHDYDDARRYLGRAVGLYRQLGDAAGQARTHLALARLREYQERPDLGLGHAQQALALFRSISHEAGEASALNGVGWFHALTGDYRQALSACQEALGRYHLLGDRRGEAVTNDSLGYAYHQLGDARRARDCYQSAVDLFRDLGDKHNQASTLVRLGDAHVTAGDTSAARGAWRRALAILGDLGHPDAELVQLKLDA
jgi:DNA-binding SARP family transcriptional activator